MAGRRIGGVIYVKIDQVALQAKGSWTINPGVDKKEMVFGADGPHGYKQMPQAASIEGVITDSAELDVRKLFETNGETVTVELANGKTFSLENAVFSGDGESTTEEGEITVEFQGETGTYVTAT